MLGEVSLERIAIVGVTDPMLIRPVILSGGSGTRLWPLSREECPKQFLPLTDKSTMLDLTIERVVGVPLFDTPLLVGNEKHEALLAEHLARAGVEGTIILEPAARNTAPAIALAALACPPGQPLLVMPSDHAIKDPEAFRAAVKAALLQVQRGRLVTFGITPDEPETGYGYIKKGSPLGAGAHHVSEFVEKPDLATARKYLDEGIYVWNAGIFLFRAQDYLAALAIHAPDVLSAAKLATASAHVEGNVVRPDASQFSRSPSISIDYAVMERADDVAVVALDAGWSDIGSWDALYAYAAKDERANAAGPDSILIDARSCLVRSSGPVVALIGVSDLLVIATDDAVLVVPRGESQAVKGAAESWLSRKA